MGDPGPVLGPQPPAPPRGRSPTGKHPKPAPPATPARPVTPALPAAPAAPAASTVYPPPSTPGTLPATEATADGASRPSAARPTIRFDADTIEPLAINPPPAGSGAPAAAAATVVAAPGPKVFAGRYEVVRELGRGGMGVVYVARDRTLGREVALKLLLVGDRADREAIERFHREARAAAGLAHAGIVQVLDVGEVDGKPFYTMEMILGRGLATVAREDVVPTEDAVDLTRQVAEALQYAHDHGILHRDIKPANVVLVRDADDRLTAKLLDFGLAKFSEREVQMPATSEAGKSLRTLTRTGAIMGTPAYMSPEQVRGAGEVDARADVYSLGATLYEILTGHPPFHDAATLVHLLYKIEKEDPVPPRTEVPDVDPDVETICLKCLAKDPNDRYRSAGALAADCRRWLAGDPIAAHPVGSIFRLWKKAKRHKQVAIPVAAFTLLLAGVTLWFSVDALVHAWRVADLRGAVEAALARKDPASVEGKAAQLRELAPRDPAAVRLFNLVKSEIAVRRGDEAFAAYVALRDELAGLRRDLEAEEKKGQAAKRHAEKAGMWLLERRVHAQEDERERLFADAVSAYSEAVAHLGENQTARERLGDLYWDRYLEAERRRSVADQNTYRQLVLRFANASYAEKLRGAKAVQVTFLLSAAVGVAAGPPAGSIQAYLYRYELNENPPVLVPVPCRPADGELLAAPLLGPAEPLPLKAVGDPAQVAAARWGSAFVLRQTPENRASLSAGADAASGRPCLSFDVRLPKGSYLLHFPSGQGVYETRYLFEVARDYDWVERCELPPESEAPPLPAGMATPAADNQQSAIGNQQSSPYWVYLPPGPYRASGDPGTQQSPPRDAAVLRVGGKDGQATEVLRPGPETGVFLARFEVTGEMYVAYLNDREWHKADDAFKRTSRPSMEPTEKSVHYSPNDKGVFAIPKAWSEWPVLGISWDDAVDYAKWLTAKKGGDGWQFRLPTEDEWERAARGADGRFYPWGDAFDPTFCRMADSRSGEQEAMNPERFGLFPMDESPLGVRDLAGGMREWTATVSGSRKEWRFLKGGSWSGPAMLCRGAGRDGVVPRNVNGDYGLRLAAARTR
ncbi:MAG: SUMF1/EgtB/PvdO family nonheme iron enzyme [Planctomycetes bacterium]|nr:SUMF1/EgtB/PvdO family nonheme iron enzyme [Planctomycetota bacterium]